MLKKVLRKWRRCSDIETSRHKNVRFTNVAALSYVSMKDEKSTVVQECDATMMKRAEKACSTEKNKVNTEKIGASKKATVNFLFSAPNPYLCGSK